MTQRICIGGLGTVLAVLATACSTIRVEPDMPLASRDPAAARVPLDFDFHLTEDPQLLSPKVGDGFARRFDGEHLAEATAQFRETLLATDAFAGVERAKPGRRLHCEVEMRRYDGMWGGGVPFALTLGLVPDQAMTACEVVARVTAPGRQPTTYRARGHIGTWLWLPLAPIGIVQVATQRGVLQRTVDAVVAQMAQDGWLDGRG